jgi:hypothetical protein
VSGNKATGSGVGQGGFGQGGGIYARGGLTLSYSTISNNEASYSGGGIYAFSAAGSNSDVNNSTLEGNVAVRFSAAAFVSGDSVTILNTTISHNETSGADDALAVGFNDVYIANSTIAFNTGGGLSVYAGNLTLQSTIVAHNASVGVPDLSWSANSTIIGADNLVMSSAAPLQGVIKFSSDPKLDPQLQYNGGSTRTHMLLAGSPAIGSGNDYAGLWVDQRGPGYARTTLSEGSYLTDIGAVQREWIFHGDFDGGL